VAAGRSDQVEQNANRVSCRRRSVREAEDLTLLNVQIYVDDPACEPYDLVSFSVRMTAVMRVPLNEGSTLELSPVPSFRSTDRVSKQAARAGRLEWAAGSGIGRIGCDGRATAARSGGAEQPREETAGRQSDHQSGPLIAVPVANRTLPGGRQRGHARHRDRVTIAYTKSCAGVMIEPRLAAPAPS